MINNCPKGGGDMNRAGLRDVARPGRLAPIIVISGALVVAVACQAAASPSPAPTAAASAGAPATTGPSASPASEAPSAPPTAGTLHWEPAGETGVARYDGRAVPLSSGRLLVLGNGGDADGFQAPTSGEVWDPATGAWTEIENLNKARWDFAAVPLADDRVLVTGGLNDDQPRQSYSSAYIYDARPGHEGWTKTGVMSAARTGPSAALLPDGRVLVAGGYFRVDPTQGFDSGSDATLAAYHPAADEGSGTATVDLGLFDIDMGSAGAALATAELFDPATGAWTATGPMNYARYGAPAVTLSDGRVLIVGSRAEAQGFSIAVDPRSSTTAEIYDPATGRFTLTGELPGIDRAAIEARGEPGANPMPTDEGEPLDVGTLVPLQDGGAALIGQTRWWKHLADMTRSFRFDAGSGTWSEIGQTWAYVGEPTAVPLTTPGVRNLSGAMAAALPDGRVLVAGGGGNSPDGFGGRTAAEVAELYDPATNTWAPLPPMPVGRSSGAVATIADGSVVLVGGLTGMDTAEQDVLASAVRLVP
jgi:hypothetical protein